MLKRLWADHRNVCLLSLALLVVGVVVSPWLLLAAVVPVGWVMLNKKPAQEDQLLTITEEIEAMSESSQNTIKKEESTDHTDGLDLTLRPDWKRLDNDEIFEKLNEKKDINPSILFYFSNSQDSDIRYLCINYAEDNLESYREETPITILEKLSTDEEPNVREAVAYHPKSTTQILEKLSKDIDDEVRNAVAKTQILLNRNYITLVQEMILTYSLL